MNNQPLRTIVAVTLDIIHQDDGFIPQNRQNPTQAKVLKRLQENSTPSLEPTVWQFADEVIIFFKNLPKHKDYQSIMERSDGPLFKTCIIAAQSEDNIPPLTFPYAVLMPHLYGKLKPEPQKLNPLQSEAKIIKPGEYLGEVNTPARFFVKLIHVGVHDSTKGGTLFEIKDRSGNIGFFYDRADRLEQKVQLGDCFAIHGTPTRHISTEKGEKQTLLRLVEVIDGTTLAGKNDIDVSHDESGGKFTKGRPF